MKDELAKTIKSIKEGEKEEFEKIIDKLNPIITKYVRAIYDGDKEDIREEYILALWEAVNKIQYVNSDGECLKYLHTLIIPGISEPPARTLRATVPENERHIFR